MPEEAHYRVSSRLFILIAVILALGLVGGGWILGLQIKQTRLGEHYVTVKGLAERTVKSDLAIWSITFRSSGDDFKTVLAQGNSQEQAVKDFLKKQGVRENELVINPPSVIDKEALEYGGLQGHQSRYILTQNIVVTSKGVDRIAAANQKIGDLLRQGVILASNGSRVSYKFNGLNSIKPDMITEATKNARAAAERFAQDSGASVGSIRSANQGIFSISAADAGGGGPEAGGGYNNPDASIMKKVRVVTTIDYYLSQ